MKKYAKVVNQETKLCEVGIGDNVDFYKSIGMAEKDVELAYDGNWYIKGYTPQEPTPTDDEQKENRARAYQAEVDPITSHIQRLRDQDPIPEGEIAELIAERDAKVEEIKSRYPYSGE